MTHPSNKVFKLFGKQLFRQNTGESVLTSQLQEPNTVIGLYFTCGSDERSSRIKDFHEHLLQFYKEMLETSSTTTNSLAPSSSSEDPVMVSDMAAASSSTLSKNPLNTSTTCPSYNFQVIMISFDETEKNIIPIPKEQQHVSSSQNSVPFLIFNDDERSKVIQEHLIRKYTVQEPPTLILLDGHSGDVLNFDGVAKICEGATNPRRRTEFPWRHFSCSEILFSGHLLSCVTSNPDNDDDDNKSSNVGSCSTSSLSLTTAAGPSSTTASSEAKMVGVNPRNVLRKDGIRGLLFSAYWCPPCRTFVSQLKEVYQRLKTKFKFEVVYVSSDRSQESYDRFMANMPWYGIPFSDTQRRLDLTSALNIKAIPTLILIDAKDNIITAEGRADLNDDLDALDFPWPRKLVEELRDKHSSVLNHYACLIYFIGEDDSEYEKAESTLQPIATQICASNVEEAFELKFFIATDSELAESLRLFIDLEESKSYLLILDIPNFRYTIASPNVLYDKQLASEFLQKFHNSQLNYRYIQSRFI